jgi:hypothetical protein
MQRGGERRLAAVESRKKNEKIVQTSPLLHRMEERAGVRRGVFRGDFPLPARASLTGREKMRALRKS